MNQHPHDYALSLGPCPDYEFDLVELQEGSLEAGRAGAVQYHLAQCSRCRAYTLALGELDAESGFDADRWADSMDAYFDEHGSLGTGPDARGPAMIMITEHPDHWAVRQIFDDPAGDHDWGISATVDLAESAEAGIAVVRVTAVGMTDA